MWIVDFSDDCMNRFKDDHAKGLFSDDDGGVIKTWVNEMETHGPEYIEKETKWGDHPLFDNWDGYRASCYSKAGRIIYKVTEGRIEIDVVRVTPDHDYKT